MVVYIIIAKRLSSGIFSSQRRVHALPGEFQRVLQSTAKMGAVDNGEHYGFAYGLQEDDKNKRQYFDALHKLSRKYVCPDQIDGVY